MSIKSSPSRYGSVAIAIHWLTALAIFGMLFSGLAASNAANPQTQFTLLRGHAVMGTLIGALTIFRVVWWQAFDKRPKDQPGLSRLQKGAAHAVHYGLYAVILVMVSSGFATVIMTGANLQLFGAAPLPLPDFTLAPPMTVHGILSRVLIAMLIGHIGAALWHQFIRRDRLLARMGLGR
ncbi:cytochrome b561 [Devosia sp. YR412]|uniref:cytochrome b n=1 Tax=Devosia sp. YR412 TaxID=1881030 RepID=UPI0008AF1B40|nr:cytochrome b [Devosia sp. YR412]SEQ24569.1 cytochrome b561 [Devosia sp. YR412]